MQSPIRFDPSLEVVQPDEEEVQAEMIRVFRKIQETTLKDYGHAVRGVHAKSHGLLTGRLTVLPGLPPALAQGLFASPAPTTSSCGSRPTRATSSTTASRPRGALP